MLQKYNTLKFDNKSRICYDVVIVTKHREIKLKLRKYQVALNKPTKKFLKNKESIRGQVWAPTGAGKTVCFTDIINYAINTLGYKNIAVVHPRIALSQDQVERAKKDFGDSIHFTSFHSGKHVARSEINGEINTTDVDTLKRIAKNANSVLGKPHLTYSSYHSFGKLIKLNFDLIIFDEAHYLIQPKYVKWLPKVLATKILSYTATPVTRDMMPEVEHQSLFGPVIAQVEPYELIKPGYIVAPLVHILHCDTNKSSEDRKVDIIDSVATAFAYQYKEVVGKNGMPYAQMLVAARNVGGDDGVGDVRTIESNIQSLRDKINRSLGNSMNPEDLLIVTVDANGAYVNGGRSRDRAKVLDEIKKCDKNVILVHYDTLAEGIDINTLTGCLIMRGLSKSKVIQTIGRCARPYLGDLDKRGNPRADLYNFDAKIDKRRKPRCIVTVPVIDGDFGNSVDIEVISEAFIVAGYGELTDHLATSTDADGTAVESLININHDKVMSAITSASLERRLGDLFELYGVEA